jgi:hypothetical protein
MGAIKRRDFISSGVLAAGTLLAAPEELPRLPSEFGRCPKSIEDFLQYIVQRRAADGLNSIVLGASQQRHDKTVEPGTIYGGATEDANVAWVAAAAYRYPWSRFHGNVELRNRAFLLLDNVVRIRGNGKWDDGGLDGFFGPHSLGWAVLSWTETGDVDAARAARWRDAVAKACDEGLICLHYGPYRPSALSGQYANPEMYFLAGLAAAWKLSGNERYREEAARALRRYDDWLFPGGGMAYFLGSSPQHNYQHMVVKSIALYHDLTHDPHAFEMLKRLAPYYPNVQHPSGLVTDAEQSHLKHAFFNPINPACPAMIAYATGDGANRRAADTAARLIADNVDQHKPSFGDKGFAWYNYQAATFAAAALRLAETHPLPAPAPPVPRRVFVDQSFRGVRSHWDDFAAAVGTRQMNDSLAGAYVADPHEPQMPLDAAIDGVYFEVLQGRQTFRCVEWSPTVGFVSTDGFAATSCLTTLCAPYWGDMPFEAGEGSHASEVSAWTSLQHWAVWRDCLIGLGSLRCNANGGEGNDAARVRWRLAPVGRKLEMLEQSERTMRFRYGRLTAELMSLDPSSRFAFRPDKSGEAPHYEWAPLLVHAAPWSAGDFVSVATVVRPAAAEGIVQVRALTHGAAIIMLEPEARKAYVWVANLYRHLQQYLLDLPEGVRVRTWKRDVEMASVPPGEPANVGLQGSESALWVIESRTPLDAAKLLAGLRAGKTR